MFKEDTNYKFKSEKDLIAFSEISNANLSIARSISKAGGVFKIQGPSFSDYYFIYVNGAKLIAGNNITPVLTKNEYQFFEEVIMPESNFTPVNKLDVFDKAVKSVREYRSERPFTKEDEALVDLLRFAVSVQ